MTRARTHADEKGCEREAGLPPPAELTVGLIVGVNAGGSSITKCPYAPFRDLWFEGLLKQAEGFQ